MRKLESHSHRTMPWKNGGGTTTEIAKFPEDSALDDFGWRISMARVDRAGPFSRFADVDRSLAILDGSGIALRIADRQPVSLETSSPPFVFPADVDVNATVLEGSIVDFNVMTRRGKFRHLLSRMQLEQSTPLCALGDVLILFVARGAVNVRHGTLSARIETCDALLVDAPRNTLEVVPDPAAEILVTDLWQVPRR